MESKNKVLREIKTVTVTGKGQIAIPKDVREIDGYGEGEKVAVLVFEDRVEIRPMSQVMKKVVR